MTDDQIEYITTLIEQTRETSEEHRDRCHGLYAIVPGAAAEAVKAIEHVEACDAALRLIKRLKETHKFNQEKSHRELTAGQENAQWAGCPPPAPAGEGDAAPDPELASLVHKLAVTEHNIDELQRTADAAGKSADELEDQTATIRSKIRRIVGEHHEPLAFDIAVGTGESWVVVVHAKYITSIPESTINIATRDGAPAGSPA